MSHSQVCCNQLYSVRGGWTSTCMAYMRVCGKTQECIIFFFSKVKRGQGEQLQAATSGFCEGQRSVLSSSVDRAELAISRQLFRFT